MWSFGARARGGAGSATSWRAGETSTPVSAPIVVEATQRTVNNRGKIHGVVAAGEAFDARDFLNSLSPEYVVVETL